MSGVATAAALTVHEQNEVQPESLHIYGVSEMKNRANA